MRRLETLAAALITITSCFFQNALLANEGEEERKEDKLARSINDFAFSLNLQITTDPTANTLFSPYSLFSTLSLTYAGARGDTAAQIAKALSLQVDVKELAAQSAKLQKQLLPAKEEKTYSLRAANALWLDRDSYILTDFRYLAQNQYGAKVESINFAEEERSISLINEWTANQTEGKIAGLLQQGDISSSTRLLITNALYFEGNWQRPFDPQNTKAHLFSTEGTSSTSILMMDQTALFPYYENENLHMLALPFVGKTNAGSNIACVFILPGKGSTLAHLNSTFTSFSFKQWMEGLDQRYVHVRIPKFTFTSRNVLNDALTALGMQTAFTPQANFSGINGMQDLFLSKVIHQAFFLMDEKGACAAAASAAAINVTAVRPTEEIPFEFIADRPFFFALVDRQSNSLLFLGSFSTPKTENSP